jgi:hypothetical protein
MSHGENVGQAIIVAALALSMVTVVEGRPVPKDSRGNSTPPTPAAKMLSTRGTFRSPPPYPPFVFHYDPQYSYIGEDICALRFGREKSEEAVFTIGVCPTEGPDAEGMVPERRLKAIPGTRRIAGYKAVKCVSVNGGSAPMWLFVTKKYPIQDMNGGRVLTRFSILLPDDERILSSFKFVK